MPFFSIIIVNYNGRKCLEVCLPSIMRQSYTNFEVIVVDNGSMDDSVAYIKSKFKNIKILNNPHNSFSSGNNLGIRQSKGDYIFILNNDVELDSNCLSALATTVKIRLANTGMWATKILNYYSRDIIDNTGLLIYRDGLCRGRGRMEKNIGQYNKTEEVFFPSGCAALYKKTIFDDVGFFDEDFEFYLEDSDLGFRARLRGWHCLFVPEAIVYHMYSVTSGQYSPFKAYLIERNRVWFTIKNFPLSLFFLSLLYVIIRYIYQMISVFFHKGSAGKFVENFSKIKLFKVFLKSWFNALKGIPRMISKRKNIQSNKKINLSEIKNWFISFKLTINELTFKN